MKIGIINDTHDRGKNSVYRLGYMHEDFMLKLDNTIKIFKKCDFIIHLGDVWDSPHVSNVIIDDWLDRIEKNKKTWYILPGNHDMIGGRWKTSNASALAHVFRRSPYVKKLEELELDGVYIKGIPYYHGCEGDFKEKGIRHNKKDMFTIVCTHAFITIKPFHPDVFHVEAKNIDTNFDLTLCSHFHTVFDKTINKTRYFNNGAWGRLSITEANHKPQVAILDTNTKQIEPIIIDHKNASECFNLEEVEEYKKLDNSLKDFKKSIEDVDFQSMKIEDMVKKVSSEHEINKNVTDLIYNKIEELKDECKYSRRIGVSKI